MKIIFKNTDGSIGIIHPTQESSMFEYNKYFKWYINLINRNQEIDGYVEVHHIIPKSLGGSDNADNLIRLTAREHFIAHLLLAKCTKGTAKSKMSYALWNMVNRDNGARTSSRMYTIIRETHSKFLGEFFKGQDNPMFGKEHSGETKKKISVGGKGLKRSKETRQKISEANKGENNSMYGIPNTKEQKEEASKRWKENNPMHNEDAVNKIKKAKLGTINCFDAKEQKFVRVKSEVYHSDKNRYKNNNSKEAKIFKGVA